MAKTIPYVGEFDVPDLPAKRKVSRLTIGPATTNDVVITDCGVYDLWNVPANTIVHSIRSIIKTAFTASVTMTVGDSDSAAGYLGSAKVASTTAVTTGILSLDSTGALKGGKLYAAAQAVQVTVAGATPAAGLAELYMEYSVAGHD